jgi:thiol-disulfide isomerase/thioredoxin/predicted negative regulator of RcsB-dependent stress response
MRLSAVAAVCACVLMPLVPLRAAPQANTGSQAPPPPLKHNPSPSNPQGDPELELQHAIDSAGNDRVALVRNLKAYITRFPDAPRRSGVYRALVEACQQLQDEPCAIENAEKLIAIEPQDSDIMLVAVNLLQKQGDDASLTRAAGYVTRVLDRVEKMPVAEKPDRLSLADWQQGQLRLRVAFYNLRGSIERQQKNYDAAEKDLAESYQLQPSAAAALLRGEICEARGDAVHAIPFYLQAFVLPETTAQMNVDRKGIRQNLGNVWRQVHGSEQGLGEAILAAYDASVATPKSAAKSANADAKNLYDFMLPKLDGSHLALAQWRGKRIVLSFWATWCGPCQELEPLFAKVAQSYAGNDTIQFLAVNVDEDQSAVLPFLARQKWTQPIALGDGLDNFLHVVNLPTVMVIDPAGKVIYRAAGYSSGDFEDRLEKAIDQAGAAGK